MPTRLRRPPIFRHLALAAGLSAFIGYLGYNAVNGQFGIEGQRQINIEVEQLRAQSAGLQAEIDSFRHRISLFDARKLDPDILTQRGRELLALAHPQDRLVILE